MSITTIDVSAELSQLKKTLGETLEHVSKDVTGKIAHLMNQFPRSENWERILRSQLERYCQTKSSDFRSIHKDLTKLLDELRRQVEAEAYHQDDFKPLSDGELEIIKKEDTPETIKEKEIIKGTYEESLVRCLRVNYGFFKHDRRICLFLAVLPKKAVLRKRFLIYWWIGEGLVQNEEEGETVFKDLLDLDLLMPHGTDKCPRVNKCKVFPWVQYMLISEAKKMKLLMNIDDGIPRFDPTNSRRVCLLSDTDSATSKKNETMPDDLRTIFNVNEKDLDLQQQSLAKMKKLVVLQLGRWQDSLTHHIEVQDESFLRGLKSQKLLKYLSLRGISRITTLPESIKELVSLEILDLKACHNLETLPATIASLKKLTHLDVSECYLLEAMPKGLHNLTSLQVLKGFLVGNSLKTPIRIQYLPSLKKLKRLSINIGSEATIKDEDFERLEQLRELKCLKISWGIDVKDQNYDLSFPARLQKLDLEGIPHETMPEWLKSTTLRNNLETLYIKGGKLSSLIDDGQKWNVKNLVLKYTDMSGITQEDLSSMFPSLQYMKKVEWEIKGESESEPYVWNKDGGITGTTKL